MSSGRATSPESLRPGSSECRKLVGEDENGSSAKARRSPVSQPLLSSAPADGEEAQCSAALEMSAARRAVVTVGSAVLLTGMSASIAVLGPFFTTDALAKHPTGGVSYHAAVGLVFSVLKFAELLAAPLISRDQPNIGSRYLAVLSSAAIGGSLMIFAFVDEISDWRAFLGLCYAIRVVHGAASVAASLSVLTLLTEVYPNKLGMVGALLQSFIAVGYGLGLLASGGLYDLGGFRLPFLTIGSFILISAAAMAFVVPPDDGRRVKTIEKRHREKLVGVSTALRYPVIWLMALNLFSTNIPIGGMDSSLGHHLRSAFGISSFSIGSVMVPWSAVGAISAPLVGELVDRKCNARLLECLGMVCYAAGCMLMAPWPWLDLPHALWLTRLSIVPLGVGDMLITVPSIYEVSHVLVERGVGSALEVRVAVAGVVRFAQALGYSVGPFLSSALVATLGFQATFSIYGYAYLGYAVLLGVASTFARHRNQRKSRSSDGKDDCLELKSLTH